MFRRSLIAPILLFVLFSVSFAVVKAQTSSTEQALAGYQALIEGDVDLTMTPLYPEPLDTVAIELSSRNVNLTKATVTWLVNGVQKKQAVGERTFSTTAGKSGQTQTVGVVVFTQDGREIRKAISFTPESVDLVVEPVGYTPPFYKGKTSFAIQGIAGVVAIPEITDKNGRRVPAKDLLYTWTINGGTDTNASGMGNSRYFFPAKIPSQATTIKVEVGTLDDSIRTAKTISVAPGDTKALVYEDHPLYGVLFNRAISNTYPINGSEVRLVAVPYFFTVTNGSWETLTYAWSAGGGRVESTTGKKQSILFRNESGNGGSVSIGLRVENSDRIFQFSDRSFGISFRGQAQTEGASGGSADTF